MTRKRKPKYTGYPAVTCPRLGHKTTGRLYRARYTAVNVCHGCRNELLDKGFRMRRVR